MTGSAAVYVVQLGCVVSGALLARRRPEHRPVAALLALGLVVDVALEFALPFGARVALGTCYPWAAWAVARGVLMRRSLRCGPGARSAIGYTFAIFVCAVLATGVRGPALARCYAAAQLVVALGCGWAVWRWRKDEGPGSLRAPAHVQPARRSAINGGVLYLYASRSLSATTVCALVVAFVEMAQPLAYLDLPSWTSGRAVYALGFVVVLVVQAVALSRRV